MATQADLVRRFECRKSTISRLAEKAEPRFRPFDRRLIRRRSAPHAPSCNGLKASIPSRSASLRQPARGDHRPDSDADLACVKGEKGDRYRVVRDFGGVGFDVMMETGILVHALPLWEGEFKEPGRFNNPALIENIKREGLRL